MATGTALQATTLQDIETFGAGVVALLIVFGIVFLTIKEFIPALKKVGETLSNAISTLNVAIDALSKTMIDLQEASRLTIASLDKRISTLETKMDYHIATANRIETQISTLCTSNAEIKERVRSCGNQRENNVFTREGDPK